MFVMNLFFFQSSFTIGNKIFNKPCCKQMHYHLGLLVHLQRTSRVNHLILEGPRVMVNEPWIQLHNNHKLLSPQQENQPVFEGSVKKSI